MKKRFNFEELTKKFTEFVDTEYSTFKTTYPQFDEMYKTFDVFVARVKKYFDTNE